MLESSRHTIGSDAMTGDQAKREIPAAGLWGFSHCAFFDSWYPWSGGTFDERLARLVNDLVDSGANSFRPHIHWRQVEPLLVADLGTPGEVTGALVEEYATGVNGVDWRRYDRMIDSLVDAGIEPHIVLGAAYDFQVPVLESGDGRTLAVPDNLGRDRYLAHAYLHARAAVRRYRDRVHLWQIENELNVAGETMLFFRWRSGRSWLDRGFLIALVETLARAVREEDPAALTSHNFHTDLRIVPGIYDWRKDVTRWLSFIDVVGVDSYPNYIFGWPSRGRVVGKAVRKAVEVSGGRPVMVLESGYPVRPRYRGFNEARQAEYARYALLSALEAGARGFYYYEMCSPEGYPVEGPWSDRFLQSVEPWWGMVRRDDSRRLAWLAYKKAMEDARVGRD